MTTLSVGDSLRFGWQTFKKRPWFFIGVVLAVIIFSGILNAFEGGEGAVALLIGLAVLIINIFLEMGLVHFALTAESRVDQVTFKDLWYPNPFWKYLAVKVLTTLIILAGLLLLIVPGVIAILMPMFSTYLVIDRNMGPIEAMKESVRLTKGHRLNLFFLLVVLLALNIVGAIAFLVGLVVTIPVTLLAIAHAYRTLEHTGGASV